MPLSTDLTAAAQAATALENQVVASQGQIAALQAQNTDLTNQLTAANAEIVRLKALLEPAPPPPPPPPPPPSPVAYVNQPPVGKLLWGATVQNNVDPGPRHEVPSGCVVGVHRSFWQWSQRVTGLLTTVKACHAKGRLPWVSIKTPEWNLVAGGNHDAEIDQLLNGLKATGKSVWLTAHHEPEGGGEGGNVPDFPSGPAAWLNMQKKFRARITALQVKNVAFAPVLMSYTWNTVSGRNPEQWWAPGIFDFLGIDHYVWPESTLITPVWQKVRDWAKVKGTEIAVGEWGVALGSGSVAAGNLVRQWYDHTANSHADGKGARIVAQAAFDYAISGGDNWTLTGEQLKVFQQLLCDSRSVKLL